MATRSIFLYESAETASFLSSPPANLFVAGPGRLIPVQRVSLAASTEKILLVALMEEEKGGEEESRGGNAVEVKEGVASIALLPCGSISGHFIQLPQSICYGLHGTELACERECSRGEDYRLIKMTVTDYNRKKERTVVVECRGHDAARFHDVDHAHGWGQNVAGMLEQEQGQKRVSVSFECETLKADEKAEEHVRRFMPKLTGVDAIVNIGRMRISGLDFLSEEEDPSETGDMN